MPFNAKGTYSDMVSCQINVNQRMNIQATLLNPDMCNPDFHINRTDWKVPKSILIHIISIRIIRILPNPDRD